MHHAKQIFPMLDCMDDLRKISDLRLPANWYVLHQRAWRVSGAWAAYVVYQSDVGVNTLMPKCITVIFICMHVVTFCHNSIVRVCVRYPEARAIQRKVVFHAGPTNSGKTYHAIQRYLAAKSGVYCGPLKLLAHEIFEKSNTAVCAGFSLFCSVS